ncbi:unnamed protein product [Spirodela intermedia]|uniref:Uncharacterized protein n=1 Tax=Spirodela intermedia TaxID=51605 RepID=A0ABN7EE02_SPIIN|nr:unnamed protein product [Spirodela intermedia]
MASKALPLMAFLLIAMLLVSAVVDATETLDTETETSVDQSGYYPNRPYCRYRCCYRYRYYYRYGYRYATTVDAAARSSTRLPREGRLRRRHSVCGSWACRRTAGTGRRSALDGGAGPSSP